MIEKKKVVIIGGGFGGLYAARALKNVPVDVTLIDKRNFHLFQPLLYQVATGGLSPADISFPLRAIFKKQKNVRVILGQVSEIDYASRTVAVENISCSFDYLIVACGATHHYFGNDNWSVQAPGLKTIEDATAIRSRILNAFEQAEVITDKVLRSAYLTFAIIGGGAAGVELAGTLAELSRETLRNDFREINPSDAQILLIEGADRILPVYPPDLSAKAAQKLSSLGVQIMTDTMVTDINSEHLTIRTKQGVQTLPARTVLWAAGVKAASLTGILGTLPGVSSDRAGRIMVNKYCQLPDQPNIFVIGDMAHFEDQQGHLLPGTAPVAMQQGWYIAGVIKNLINKNNYPEFYYKDKGNLAVIGRRAAVAFRKDVRLAGFFAWLLWIFVHLLYLVGFENRILVAIQWSFNYITRNRSARLITFPKETLQRQ